MFCLGFASVILLETQKNVILEENYHPSEMPMIRVNGYPLLRIRIDGVPMRSVVETIPCKGVKLFMQMTHECLWAY